MAAGEEEQGVSGGRCPDAGRGGGAGRRTGNASVKFNQVDDYVRNRLRRFMLRRKASRWTHDFFNGHGLYRQCGTIKYPEAA